MKKNKKENGEILIIILIIIIIIALIILSIKLIYSKNENTNASRIELGTYSFEENSETLRNVDRGFYKLVQIELSSNKEDLDNFIEIIQDIQTEDEDVSIISFQLNLKNYVNKSINKDKIQEIQEYFNILRENGYKVIFRVVYDSEGEENPEPEFNNILEHIETLKSIYEKNEDILLVIEAGYLGSYGEWHSGKYDDDVEYRNRIIQKLLEVVPKSITINLRKPSFITDYTTETLTEDNAYSGVDVSRLGLHNDGYLASDTDYGTYEREERKETLEYQHELTKYTIFGGECQNKDSIYTNIENAISDMENRHCTYLNKTYDREVKEKWKQTTVNTNSDDIYSGENGYKYIQDNLGYRLVIKNSAFYREEDRIGIQLNLENRGFGNIVNKKDVDIILESEDNTHYIRVDTDIRKDILNDKILDYIVELPRNLKDGNYKVYIKISEPYESLKEDSNYSIKFANINIWNEELGANYIGEIVIN